MKFIEHIHNQTKVIEVESEAIIINSEQDVLDLMANINFQYHCRKIVIYQHQLNPDFFDLKTGLAGAILQKIANYQFQLAVIGDFANIESKSLRDFIYESNRGHQMFFVSNINEAMQKLK